ncbi:unnamed protein product [Discosporangium mesarthrocarpum]
MNENIVETVQKLCREGNRDSVLTVFQDFPEHFSCIPLNDSNVEPKQAINDLLRENVILNGVKFFGNGELFLESLRQVVETLSLSPDYKGSRTGSEIVERVLCKASRTTSGSDSYFTVDQLFTNSDYLLKRRAECLPPINIEVFLVDNNIHSVVACANYYGLYSLDEIESASQSFKVHTPQAWLCLDTMVVEKTDYRTGRNVRYLRVDTPDRPSSHQPSGGQGPSATTPPAGNSNTTQGSTIANAITDTSTTTTTSNSNSHGNPVVDGPDATTSSRGRGKVRAAVGDGNSTRRAGGGGGSATGGGGGDATGGARVHLSPDQLFVTSIKQAFSSMALETGSGSPWSRSAGAEVVGGGQ